MRPATHSERKSEEPYLLGTDPEEGRRLETQHRLWAEAARDLWDRAEFGTGARLLDLGCGPGFAALELAARVGAEGRVLAVDESRRFIDALVREAGRLGMEQLTARVERNCGWSPPRWTAPLRGGSSAFCGTPARSSTGSCRDCVRAGAWWSGTI